MPPKKGNTGREKSARIVGTTTVEDGRQIELTPSTGRRKDRINTVMSTPAKVAYSYGSPAAARPRRANLAKLGNLQTATRMIIDQAVEDNRRKDAEKAAFEAKNATADATSAYKSLSKTPGPSCSSPSASLHPEPFVSAPPTPIVGPSASWSELPAVYPEPHVSAPRSAIVEPPGKDWGAHLSRLRKDAEPEDWDDDEKEQSLAFDPDRVKGAGVKAEVLRRYDEDPDTDDDGLEIDDVAAPHAAEKKPAGEQVSTGHAAWNTGERKGKSVEPKALENWDDEGVLTRTQAIMVESESEDDWDDNDEMQVGSAALQAAVCHKRKRAEEGDAQEVEEQAARDAMVKHQKAIESETVAAKKRSEAEKRAAQSAASEKQAEPPAPSYPYGPGSVSAPPSVLENQASQNRRHLFDRFPDVMTTPVPQLFENASRISEPPLTDRSFIEESSVFARANIVTPQVQTMTTGQRRFSQPPSSLLPARRSVFARPELGVSCCGVNDATSTGATGSSSLRTSSMTNNKPVTTGFSLGLGASHLSGRLPSESASVGQDEPRARFEQAQQYVAQHEALEHQKHDIVHAHLEDKQVVTWLKISALATGLVVLTVLLTILGGAGLRGHLHWYGWNKWRHNIGQLVSAPLSDQSCHELDLHWNAVRERLEASGLVDEAASKAWDAWLENNIERVTQSQSSQGIPDGAFMGLVTRGEFLREIETHFKSHASDIEDELGHLKGQTRRLTEKLTALTNSPSDGMTREEAKTLIGNITRQAIADAQLDAASTTGIDYFAQTGLCRAVNYLNPGNGAMVNPFLTSPSAAFPKCKFFSKYWCKNVPRYAPSASGALDAGNDVGDCWCGSLNAAGAVSVDVTLINTIVPQDLILRHIDPAITISPDSMPKDVEFWAYVVGSPQLKERAHDWSAVQFPDVVKEPEFADFTLLGKFSYDYSPRHQGRRVYRFSDELLSSDIRTDRIVVRATNNYGSNFTCFYQISLYGESRN